MRFLACIPSKIRGLDDEEKSALVLKGFKGIVSRD
jgi:hypothetical protein